MSSGDPPVPPPLPGAYRPGDRVRVVNGMFANIGGVVLGPALDCPVQPTVQVRLRIWNRDVDVALQPHQLQPAPPAG
jgi:transcription antitermination factor NusG